jgi:hypothetical protein
LRRQAEAEEKSRQAQVNREGAMAIFGAVAIGHATAGKNLSESQQSSLVDAYVQDRASAANGVKSNKFDQAANSVSKELNFARMAEQSRRDRAAAANNGAERDSRPSTTASTQSTKPQHGGGTSMVASDNSFETRWREALAAPKVISERVSLSGFHQKESMAREAVLKSFDASKESIQSRFERHLAYERFINNDPPECIGMRGPRTKAHPEGEVHSWSCKIEFRVEVVGGQGTGAVAR